MTTDIKKQLGLRIKKLRKDRGLSQEKLAEKIGISTNGLGQVETGKYFMSLTNLEKLMDVLDIEPYELFIFNKEEPKNIVYDDIIKRMGKIKNSNKKLYVISEMLDRIE